jgi:hypothetical protein
VDKKCPRNWKENQVPRKSSASLEVHALGLAPVAKTRRLTAPAHISDAERAVWVELVNDQPAEAFRTTHVPLIEMYCRHVVASRTLADEILNFDRAWLADDEGLKRYDKLLTMHERESRAASALATRLRITRQAVDHPTTVGRQLANEVKAKKPWQLGAPVTEDVDND